MSRTPDKAAPGPRSDDRGASLVIALTIIFVLSTLGSIALLVTLSNARMGSAVADWTSDFYALDEAAEDAMAYVDGILLKAERFAFAYMRDEMYREGDAAPRLTGDAATELTDEAQGFIHGRWLSDVFLPAGGGEGAVDDEAYNGKFPRFHDEFFSRLFFYYAHKLLAQAGSGGAAVGPGGGAAVGPGGGAEVSVELSAAMARFIGMADGGVGGDGGGSGADGGGGYGGGHGYGPAEEGGMSVTVDVSGQGAGGHAKHLAARLHVVAPRFGLATEADDVPFRTNPVWTNAVTAKGTITFAGSSSRVRVVGDVAAQDYNEYYPAFGDFASPTGNAHGVACAGAAVEILGNVYTRGDFHVTESGGSVDVGRYPPGLSVEYKTDAYTNTLFFDTSLAPAMIQRYVQLEREQWARAFIPFFYRDSLGGNVYCNSLAIEAGVAGGSIHVMNGRDTRLSGGQDASSAAGVVWTLDDVQNDGASSVISIDGNLIGLSSETAFADHMSSSAVINADPGSSVIRLGGAAVIPGTAFMRFDGVNDQTSEDTYFETAESATADDARITRAYTERPVRDAGAPYYFDNFLLRAPGGPTHFFLVHYDVMVDQARHLVWNLANGPGGPPATGVVVPGAFEGYARGAVLAQDEEGAPKLFGAPGIADEGGEASLPGYGQIVGYAQNYMAYSETRDSLKAAFRSKTESLGTANQTIEGLVDKSVAIDEDGRAKPGLPESFICLVGDSELELEGEMRGIVYCAARPGADGGAGGDAGAGTGAMPTLRVSGTGTFYGTIICEGDIVIEGTPTIQYDESVISRAVLKHPQAKAFFAPGEQGATSHARVLRVAQSAQRLSGARYVVDSWMEWQE